MRREAFDQFYKIYYDVASDIWLFSKFAADCLKSIVDLVISIGLKVLAAYALSPTGIGAGISWGLAAYDCWRVLELWGKITKALSITQLTINGFASLCLTPTPDTINALRPLPMPATNYNHPGVE